MNNHIVRDDDGSLFHSNGYARIANGDKIGSVSPMSFDRRRQIENNRRVIMGYNRSSIANNHTSVARTRPTVDFRASSSTTSNVNAAPIRTAPQFPRKFNRFG